MRLQSMYGPSRLAANDRLSPCTQPLQLQWRYRSGFTPDYLFSFDLLIARPKALEQFYYSTGSVDVNGYIPMVTYDIMGLWSVVSGQWSVVSGQGLVISQKAAACNNKSE